MSRISFENYGKRAQQMKDYTKISGRYQIQDGAERNIFSDVIRKLEIHEDNTLFDIGCGAGNLTIPLAFICKVVTGIDHESCIVRLKQRCSEMKNIELIAGNFLDVQVNKKFDRILCYSVLHYLTNKEEVLTFINKSLQYLKLGGRALFGDIPNFSRKQRFLDSASGKIFSHQWNKLMAGQKPDLDNVKLDSDTENVQFDDTFMLEIIKQTRASGYHSYILSQPGNLPFGYTREDILVIKTD